MEKWQESYENWIDGRDQNDLEKEIDELLKEWLPDEIFEEYFNKSAALQAQCEEEAFHAGWLHKMDEATE